MVKSEDYNSPVRSAWCPGCGNFGILRAIKEALAQVGLAPHQVLMVTGIGQAAKLPDYMTINAFTTLHGRPIPVAQGAHLANHGLKVIVASGDGDTYGEGGNHLFHAMRRNVDITFMVHDNMVYGLTKGQYSPTSPKGFPSKTSPPPAGALEQPENPLALAITAGATFVARGYAGDNAHLVRMMVAAIRHKGAALLDILQPCVTFNPNYSFPFFRERVYKLEDEGWNPKDRKSAWEKAYEWGDRIPIGILYEDTSQASYEEQVPTLAAGPLVKQPFRTWTEEDYRKLEAEFL
jgi:2-oxoglutarate/2-oxoacid ferredoxin oxidoreductase subunit beta